MNIEKAVVLICDVNFFLSSYGSALSARLHTALWTRVIIFVLDAPDKWLENVNSIAQADRIEVYSVHIPEIGMLKGQHKDRYLPASTLARFWISRFLPNNVARFLYIDGDVLVEDDLEILLSMEVPDDRLLVAADTVGLSDGEFSFSSRNDISYLRGLGVPPTDYFNAGLIVSTGDTWRTISNDALRFLLKYPELCRSSDQSAINAVAVGKTVKLCQRWNYQSDHMTVIDLREAGFKPGVWHFTGAPKPWHYQGWPWCYGFTWAFDVARERFCRDVVPEPVPPQLQLKEGLEHRARARNRLRYLYPLRRLARKRKILTALSEGFGK